MLRGKKAQVKHIQRASLPFSTQDMLINNTTDTTCKVGNCFPLEGKRFYFDLQIHTKKKRIKVIVFKSPEA